MKNRQKELTITGIIIVLLSPLIAFISAPHLAPIFCGAEVRGASICTNIAQPIAGVSVAVLIILIGVGFLLWASTEKRGAKKK